jgi:hypothetical protein
MGVGAPVPLTLLLLRMLATAGAYETAREGADDCGNSHDCGTCTKNSSGCSWCQASTQCVKCSGAISCGFATKLKCTAKEMITAPSQCPSDDNKVWRPPAPAPPITYCPYENLTCQHGTTMNASYCQRIKLINWPVCLNHSAPGGWDGECIRPSGQHLSGPCTKPACIDCRPNCGGIFPDPGLPEFMDLGAVCQCPPHLNGTDCAIVKAPASMPPGKQDVCRQPAGTAPGASELKWDGSYLNPNLLSPKHSECFFTTDGFAFATNNHRINVTIFPGVPVPPLSAAAAGSGSAPGKLYDIELVVSMRRRADHKNAESAALQVLFASHLSVIRVFIWGLPTLTSQCPLMEPGV